MQTSVSQFQNVASNGSFVGTGPHEVGSAVCEAAVALGSALIRGTDPVHQVLNPSALFDAALAFRGFAILPQTKSKTIAAPTTAVSWDINEQVPVAEEGRFAIQCESAFVAGAQCRVVCIAAGAVAAQTVGRLTATVDAVNAQPINAIFETSGAAGEVAVISLYKQI